jgi:hypothetical protein
VSEDSIVGIISAVSPSSIIVDVGIVDINVVYFRKRHETSVNHALSSGLINRGSSSSSLVVTFFRHNFAENGLQDLKMV